MKHLDCMARGFTTRQVGDAEYRCNGCDGDVTVMEDAEAILLLAQTRCRKARWPELHDDGCEFCAYLAAGGPSCRYDRTPLIDDQERTHGICGACWAEGSAEANYA